MTLQLRLSRERGLTGRRAFEIGVSFCTFRKTEEMARIAGLQTIKSPSGEVQKLVIDVNKALKNEQIAEIVEDLLDHLDLEKAKENAKLIPWNEAKERIDKKFGFE